MIMSKGLEALENIALNHNRMGNEKDFDIIEKELKALEIIKNRQCIFYGLKYVSQEEYDLLKEVLC